VWISTVQQACNLARQTTMDNTQDRTVFSLFRTGLRL
jgi:hypothetical protein